MGGVLGRVERTVRTMPLWKLQTVGRERLEFLYDDRESEDLSAAPSVSSGTSSSAPSAGT